LLFTFINVSFSSMYRPKIFSNTNFVKTGHFPSTSEYQRFYFLFISVGTSDTTRFYV